MSEIIDLMLPVEFSSDTKEAHSLSMDLSLVGLDNCLLGMKPAIASTDLASRQYMTFPQAGKTMSPFLFRSTSSQEPARMSSLNPA
jgi:hypothetical protein